MKRILQSLSIVIISAGLLISCYPSDDVAYSDLDVAVTHYDGDFEFSNNAGKVCVIFDTVAHVVDEDEEPEKSDYDDLIIEQVLKNVDKLGFDTVILAKQASDIVGYSPDVAITLTLWENDYYSYYYYPYYDYWYWGWYYKSASLKSANNIDYYYYPYYPWGGSWYYSYSTGTIIIDMVNVDEIETPDGGDDKIDLPIIWTGLVNGIVSGKVGDQTSRITNEIEQVFNQSPYLFN